MHQKAGRYGGVSPVRGGQRPRIRVRRGESREGSIAVPDDVEPKHGVTRFGRDVLRSAAVDVVARTLTAAGWRCSQRWDF